LSAPAERDRSRQFVLEGYRLHERAVRAGAQVDVVLIARAALDDPTPRMAELKKVLVDSGTRLVAAPDEIVEGLTAGRGDGPLVGIVSMPVEQALEPGSGAATYLVAADVEDPGNVGAMIRTALAAGCDGFVAAGVSDPYHPKAVRTSMGSLFRIPVWRYQDSPAAARALKGAGIKCIGAVSRGGTPLCQAGLGRERAGNAFFLGSEAWGLPDSLKEMLDAGVTIPMAEDVDSFSVNAAAAIVLYELFRGQ
jgi:TrmH family RNA methyltransferase